ncbi:hypothetical protein DEO23_03615 [Brachybacterium endophyticum]|uniref:Uncharacterized protein n=1 Tax=Brachybacterium endophyticum TaxID=2182385 RepID=A0A2U2RPD2_9MICO|nr:hypothetical protein [Brachybacterium endophyticum]PWH07716.1 hypothetical protein DEO23_03615 [Brachybacterium endophyticum]
MTSQPSPETAQDPQETGGRPSASPADGPVPAHASKDRAPESAEDRGAPDEGTVLYVRRRRVPTLGFWVTLSIIVGLLAGAVTALITRVDSAGGVIYFAVTGAVFIGLPLALIAAVVDAVIHRGERRRPR